MKITALQKKEIKKLARRYGLLLVLFFGSRVEAGGKYVHKFSDFDLAILPNEKLNLMEEGRITIELMAIFKTERLDLVNLKKATPLIMYQIFSNYQVLYKKSDSVLTEYEIYAFKRYIEARPLREMSDKLFTEKIRQYKRDLQYA